MKRPQIKYLDAIWSKTVKIRWGGKCARCGKDDWLNSHHIYGKNNFNLRWDLRNGICLCGGCHMWTEQNSIPSVEFIKEAIGKETVSYLEKEAAKRPDKHDYDLVKNQLMKG